MSYWEHRKPVRRARAVDVEAIAVASVALLDAGGLRALTVRAVAHRLDVAPASLYSRLHVVDDLFDIALDHALGADPDVEQGLRGLGIRDLMLVFHQHLCRHPWACQVIGMRTPRGPNYLRLSERMCRLLRDTGVPDPLGTSYTLSNYVIGSATTIPSAHDEVSSPIDAAIAPLYARLRTEHHVDHHQLLGDGLDALLAYRRSA